MHDWMGIGLIALGLGLVAAGFVKRHNRIHKPLPAGAIRPEFAAMGEIARPMILFAVGFFALKMSLFYFVLGGERYLTRLDFAGILFVLAAYSAYVVLATTQRAVAAADTVELESAADARRAA
jgi:hypothetical protein